MSDPNERKPLAGITVLVTRAREQTGGLVDGLEAMGAGVRVVPAIHMEPEAGAAGSLRQALSDPESYDHLVFTSVNGVEFFLEFLEDEGTALSGLPPALCVGSKTALAWEAAGGAVAMVPGKYTAFGLLEELPGDLAGHRFLILRPRDIRTPLGELLKERGAAVREVVLYRTLVPPEGAASLARHLAEGLDAILFASPSAVEGVMEISGRRSEGEGRQILEIPAVCIGPTTAKAAEDAGFNHVYFPDEHTAEGMVEELLVIAGGLKNRSQEPGARSQEQE